MSELVRRQQVKKGRWLFTCHTDSCFKRSALIAADNHPQSAAAENLADHFTAFSSLQTCSASSTKASRRLWCHCQKGEFCSLAFKLRPLYGNLDEDEQESDFEHEKSSCVVCSRLLSAGGLRRIQSELLCITFTGSVLAAPPKGCFLQLKAGFSLIFLSFTLKHILLIRMIARKPHRTILPHYRLTRSLSENWQLAIMRGYIAYSYYINDAVLRQNKGLGVMYCLDCTTGRAWRKMWCRNLLQV